MRTSIAVLIIVTMSAVLGCAQVPEQIYVTATPHPRVATETAEARAETERQMQESIRATVAAIVPTPEPESSIQTKVAEALATETPQGGASMFGDPTPPATITGQASDLARVALERGIGLAKNGDYPEALEELETAQRLHGGSSEEAEVWLSRVQDALGNTEAALRHQENAQALREGVGQPGSTPIPATPHPGVVINTIQPPGAPTPTTTPPTPAPTPVPNPAPTPYNTDEEYKTTEYERVRGIELNEGDCIVFEEERGEFDVAPRKVPCNGEWTHKVLGSFETDGTGPYPGKKYFGSRVLQQCDPRTSDFLYPSEEDWQLGGRKVDCLQQSFGLSVTDPGKIDRLHNINSVREGSCINQAPETGGSQVELVDCSGTWEIRLLNKFVVSNHGEYPGKNWLNRQAVEHCERRRTDWLYPDQDAWSIGQRTVQCLQENLTGERGISSILDRLVNPFLLNLNECVNSYENPDLFLAELTACSGEWEFQVIRTVRIPGDGAYPGDQQIEDKSFEICGTEIEYAIYPGEIGWQSGYREVICLRTGSGYIETPTPAPAGNGDWTYFGPECPDRYENCAYETSDDSKFISLTAYQDEGRPVHERANIMIMCFEGNPYFSLDASGRQVAAKDAVLNVRFVGQSPDEGISSLIEGWSDDLELVWPSTGDETEIIRFLGSAELQRRGVTLEISGGPDAVTAHFDVTGFTTNFQRLPCSN